MIISFLLLSLLQSAGEPGVDEIFKNYLDSVGALAIERFSAQTKIGTLAEGPVTVPFLAKSDSSGAFEATIKTPRADVRLDGKTAMAVSPAGSEPLGESELPGIRVMADYQFPLWLAGQRKNLRVLGRQTVKGRDCYQLADSERHAVLKLYFDVESGYLLQVNDFLLSDYREVDGMKTPHTVHNQALNRTMTFTEVKNTPKR